MRDEILKICFTAVTSFAIGAGTFAYAVSAKASQWEHDKPYIAATLAEMGADVKTLLAAMSRLEGGNARRSSRQ